MLGRRAAEAGVVVAAQGGRERAVVHEPGRRVEQGHEQRAMLGSQSPEGGHHLVRRRAQLELDGELQLTRPRPDAAERGRTRRRR